MELVMKALGLVLEIDVILPERRDVSEELPDAAWDKKKCRGPSTQPHFPFGFAQGLQDLVNG